MPPPKTDAAERERTRRLDDEIERYRESTEATLQQLEWTAGYLRTIRKPEIARALDRNRKQIEQRLH
jgi:hypothetical protein